MSRKFRKWRIALIRVCRLILCPMTARIWICGILMTSLIPRNRLGENCRKLEIISILMTLKYKRIGLIGCMKHQDLQCKEISMRKVLEDWTVQEFRICLVQRTIHTVNQVLQVQLLANLHTMITFTHLTIQDQCHSTNHHQNQLKGQTNNKNSRQRKVLIMKVHSAKNTTIHNQQEETNKNNRNNFTNNRWAKNQQHNYINNTTHI